MTGKFSENIDSFIAIGIGMLIVLIQHRGNQMVTRLAIAGCSGGIGYLAIGDFQFDLIGPLLTLVAVTAFSYAVIDVLFALLRDRELVKSAIKKIVGAKEGP